MSFIFQGILSLKNKNAPGEVRTLDLDVTHILNIV